jgi:iron complex outermembrane receptor protein
VVDADINAVYSFGKHAIGIGVNYRNENIRSTNLGFNTRDYTGIFAEYKLLIRKFSASAGIYGQYNSEWGFELFPGADVGYDINSNVKLYANVGTGERLPTYTDLYYDGPSNIGNANLIPEKGISAESGIKVYNSFMEVNGSVSYKNISDFIDYTRVDVNDQWQPNNFQTIKTTVYNIRFEFNAGRQLQWNEKNNILVSSSYSYLEPDVTNNTAYQSKYAIESLRHLWISSVNFKANQLLFSVTARYQYRINGNDYTILDSRLSYRLKKFTIYADVSNILDTEYREIASVPLPGRWYGLGIKFSTAGASK